MAPINADIKDTIINVKTQPSSPLVSVKEKYKLKSCVTYKIEPIYRTYYYLLHFNAQ